MALATVNNPITAPRNDNITNTNNNTNTENSNTTNQKSNAILDKDAFLKLLLIEMQHQDPTDPMDSEKMLSQTSQLAALEMQQNTNETMQKMVETMTLLSESMMSNSNLSVLNAIGKMATIQDIYIPLNSANDKIDVKMYLPKETLNGATFEVLNEKGDVVRKIKVAKDKLEQGTNVISWDGKNDEGIFVGAGKYTVKVSYTDIDGQTSKSSFGSYPVESVRFQDGKIELQIAGKYVKFDEIKELS